VWEKSHRVRFEDLGGQGVGKARSTVPFGLETPFYFDDDRSVTSDCMLKSVLLTRN
jgi:hypothetical protein